MIVYSMAWFDESLPDAVVEVAEARSRAAERGITRDEAEALDAWADEVLKRWHDGEFDDVPVRRFEKAPEPSGPRGIGRATTTPGST